MIHEEGPIFLEGDSIGLYEEKSSYERVPNSAWLPKQSRFEFPDLTTLDFCMWGWMKS
jgi:hypothetical protein